MAIVQKQRFSIYLRQFICEKGSKSDHTHTRIGSTKLNIFGGSFIIPDKKKDEFYDKYYNDVFIEKNVSYLTEKQSIEHGPLLLDFDLLPIQKS